jgi:hypothetical protein
MRYRLWCAFCRNAINWKRRTHLREKPGNWQTEKHRPMRPVNIIAARTIAFKRKFNLA